LVEIRCTVVGHTTRVALCDPSPQYNEETESSVTNTRTSSERPTLVTEFDVDQTNDAPVDRVADAIGVERRPSPTRRWVQSASAGHLSGLVWGSPRSDVVLVHDLGDSSNGWDAVAIASDRDVVALDLAGHGRSSAADAVRSPAKQSPALLDAIRSFAPSARLVVASGLGAAIALQSAIKRPAAVPAILVIDGGPVASGAGPLVDPDGFGSIDDVVARLTAVAAHRHPVVIRHLAAESTVPRPDGRLDWRYQLGERPDDVDAWSSVDHFHEPPVPLGVVTATTGDPVDPIVRSILRRWPGTPRLVVGTAESPDGTDLVASQPVEVARAIDDFLTTLSSDPSPSSGATA
jgi:pimeloyl-ACP methyl ester carboxylesterase